MQLENMPPVVSPHARAKADKLAPKPANLTLEQAAAIPVSGVTAMQALRDKARVRAGERVLVIGASGGVGTFADLLALKEVAEQGRLTPVIDRTYPLADAAAAVDHLEEGHPRGKVVLTI